MVKISQISPLERRTFYLYFFYAIIEGTLAGIVALNEFVFLKSLVGQKFQLGLMYQLPQMVLLFAVILNEIIRRTKHKKNFLLWFVVATRIPLFLVLFFPTDLNHITAFHQYAYLAILLVYFMSMPVMFPTVTFFLRNTFSPENFGKLYSYATTAGKIALVITTFVTGLILDHNQFYYRWLYVYMAVAGIFSIFVFTRIPYNDMQYEVRTNLWASVKSSYLRMKEIVKTNRPFRHYQIAFMLYGIGYMITDSVIPLYLKEVFHLNYSSLAFYKNSFNIINISLLPFFGHIINKVDQRKFAAFSFLALAFSMLFFALSYYFRQNVDLWHIKMFYFLIIAYIFYGIFAATMALAWYIGPAYFCPSHQAGDYQSVHLMFTGVRGMFAPILGIVLYTLLNFVGVFAIAFVFLLLAIAVMLISKRNDKIEADLQL